ncbi:MAG: SRPBCC family protein [Phycisphaerales bacterium]|nr:SRPBCC family protein [Phycisphaerales bacterium]
MREFHLHTEQTLNAPLSRVFDFFSNAENLQAITPPFLKFKITSPTPIPMRAGAEIDYALSLHGLRFNWRSGITAWEPGVRFVDEQVKGPYRRWVHEHRFAPDPADPARTIVTDHVRYAVPGWFLQSPIHTLLVRPRLDRIFAYRAEATRRLIEH